KCKSPVRSRNGAAENITITRKEFEEAISSFVAQTEMLCESTLEEAKLSADELKGVFLVGGSTRIPCIKEAVLKVFKKEPVDTANVDEVVALGAAIYAAYKSDHDNLSAIQKKAVEKIKFSEMTAKCFGTLAQVYDETRKQDKAENTVIIMKGEKIPISVTKQFFTKYDGQNCVECEVTESTSPETDPKFVKVIWEGELKLPDGRPANQQIDITFSFNDNQIMECSFLDVASGNDLPVDLEMGSSSADVDNNIEKFIVE
ncbi:uncharacterized protein METZ01_LOCUS413840, partial [marine metagenome]